MTDKLAQAAADRSAELMGTHTDMVFPDWENANPGMREFWREIVSTVTGAAAKHPDKPKAEAKADDKAKTTTKKADKK